MHSRSDIIDAISPIIVRFLTFRIKQLQKSATGILNVNPFLVRALKSVIPMESQSDLSLFAFYPHIAHGFATAFAKRVDEEILPAAFGTVRLDAKYRNANGLGARHFDDIDHVVYRRDGEFLLSLKASAWSIRNYPRTGQAGAGQA